MKFRRVRAAPLRNAGINGVLLITMDRPEQVQTAADEQMAWRTPPGSGPRSRPNPQTRVAP